MSNKIISISSKLLYYYHKKYEFPIKISLITLNIDCDDSHLLIIAKIDTHISQIEANISSMCIIKHINIQQISNYKTLLIYKHSIYYQISLLRLIKKIFIINAIKNISAYDKTKLNYNQSLKLIEI